MKRTSVDKGVILFLDFVDVFVVSFKFLAIGSEITVTLRELLTQDIFTFFHFSHVLFVSLNTIDD